MLANLFSGRIVPGFLVLASTIFSQTSASHTPVKVTIEDEKPTVAAPSMPIDPESHVLLRGLTNLSVGIQVDKQMLHLGYIQTLLQIDGDVVPRIAPNQFSVRKKPLPPGKDGAERTGFYSVCSLANLTITQEVEVVPSNGKGGKKRKLDAAMVRYLVENKDNQPHRLGIRITMNTMIGNNRGALFAAPNHPNKILDGVELRGPSMPGYLQILQKPDLKDPGLVAHLSWNLGQTFAKPDRLVLTRIGSARNQWDLQAVPALANSALGFYWEPKEIPAGGHRRMAYAYGVGLVSSSDDPGQLALVLGGSFEPGKQFTVSAYVEDPAPGQVLTLSLPDGMTRLEGKQSQPVPAGGDGEKGLVLWKCRVLHAGRFPVRVTSSTGITQTKVVTIRKAESEK